MSKVLSREEGSYGCGQFSARVHRNIELRIDMLNRDDAQSDGNEKEEGPRSGSALCSMYDCRRRLAARLHFEELSGAAF